jgi:Escherichia/Staphylococcus phage prohead protease
MQLKTMRAAVKTIDDENAADGSEGTFEAIVSTYGVDSIGDQVMPGAFTQTLSDWKESGAPIPVIWSHRHDDPFAHVGEVLDAQERENEGLWVKAQLDMDNPTGRQVYKLLKGGRVRQFSFAYDVEDSESKDDGITQLKQLKLYEVGPTLIGMNQQTDLLDVKGLKRGRVLSAKNESDLRKAVDLIGGVLKQLDSDSPDDGDDGKSSTATSTTSTSAPSKDEDRESGKSEDSNRSVSVDAMATVISLREKELA